MTSYTAPPPLSHNLHHIIHSHTHTHRKTDHADDGDDELPLLCRDFNRRLPLCSCCRRLFCSGIKSGTDSVISVTLGDSSGRSVWIPNLELWGLMGRNHDYFEMGNLDIFSGRGPCIGGPLCHLNLTSDGSGAHHGWFCEYIEVTSTGPHKECSQTIFYVDRWLATDAPPFDLTVVLDGCLKDAGPRKHGETGAFIVGKQQQQQQPIGSASE